MIHVTFITADGAETMVSGREGDSVMQLAIMNDVPGIVGECGGSMMCATCHCYLGDGWTERIGARRDDEGEMLDCAASEVLPSSRLSCQVKLTPELDGLVVHLPEAQV